jgi:hypothetical protein
VRLGKPGVEGASCKLTQDICRCCCQVLNYGQSVFEGMKAQRTADGRIVLFRWANRCGTGHSGSLAAAAAAAAVAGGIFTCLASQPSAQ